MLHQMRVDPSSSIPVTLQLKEQLKQLILRGSLEPGAQLPTVRELAGYLRLNRNTVVRALRELQREGYVQTHRGKGVFVARTLPGGDKADQVGQLVDDVLRRAMALGLSADDLAMALLARAQLSTSPGRPVPRLLLLECNEPALRLYRRNLEEELGAAVEPLLISELQARLRQPNFSSRYALAVTTFFHVEEVEPLLRPFGLQVVAVLAEASLETLIRLTRLSPGTTVGLVCENREATENMALSVRRAGLAHLRLLQATLDDEDLRDVLGEASVVVTSSECAPRVRALMPDREILVEDRRLDRCGVELLRRLLAEKED